MNDINGYYTKEELEQIKKQGAKLGPERIQAVQEAWPKLIAKVKAEMEQGTDPKDPKVQDLAKEWMALVKEFTAGNPAIEGKLKKMYQEKGKDLSQQFGDGVPNQEMMEYMQKALA